MATTLVKTIAKLVTDVMRHISTTAWKSVSIAMSKFVKIASQPVSNVEMPSATTSAKKSTSALRSQRR